MSLFKLTINIILVLGLNGLFFLVSAQNTWTGATDNSWHRSCNWSFNSIPTCADDVLIPFTSNQPVITGDAYCKSIDIMTNSGANLTVNYTLGGRLDIVNCGTPTDLGGCGPGCGSQQWATANLNIGTRINGTTNQTNNGSAEKYCYNNIDANCSTYGGLYTWDEAMNYTGQINCDPCGAGGRQGLCPAGYHIPTDLEWSRYEWCVENNIAPAGSTSLSTFQNTVGYRGSNVAGVGSAAKMKASTGWNGTNGSGFAALPGGYYSTNTDVYNSLGGLGYYWSATLDSGTRMWTAFITTGQNRTARFSEEKIHALSVRCLKN